MNVISWILFGLVFGIIVNLIDPHPERGGLVGAIMLGISGALAGGFLAVLLLGTYLPYFVLSSFLVAVSGSLIMLFLDRTLDKKYN